MKISKYLALGFLVISLTPVWGQQGQNFGTVILANSQSPTSEATNLTKFNLDFPGGTPAELIKAVEKAMGKPLNVIIPDEDADTKLPALKLSDINFSQLSETFRQGSFKQVAIRNSSGNYESISVGYYFRTTDNVPSDNSVWFFYDEKLPPAPSPQKICRFYSLEIYLNRGFTVDDITTAIQTGWKMAGITSLPELNYHKETKLLIAFGEPDELQTIQNVLTTLPSSNATHDQIDNLTFSIEQLQKQVTELNKKISAVR